MTGARTYSFRFEVTLDPEKQDLSAAIQRILGEVAERMRSLQPPNEKLPFCSLTVIDLGWNDEIARKAGKAGGRGRGKAE